MGDICLIYKLEAGQHVLELWWICLLKDQGSFSGDFIFKVRHNGNPSRDLQASHFVNQIWGVCFLLKIKCFMCWLSVLTQDKVHISICMKWVDGNAKDSVCALCGANKEN